MRIALPPCLVTLKPEAQRRVLPLGTAGTAERTGPEFAAPIILLFREVLTRGEEEDVKVCTKRVT
jgi:hypothetical protein